MKRYFIPVLMLSIVFGLNIEAFTQQIEYNLIHDYPSNDEPFYMGKLIVTSSEGNLDNSGVYKANPIAFNYSGNPIPTADAIDSTFNTFPTNKLLKATAGKPITLNLTFELVNTVDTLIRFNGEETGPFELSLKMGKNEQASLWDRWFSSYKSGYEVESNVQRISYSQEFTIPVGRTRGWVILEPVFGPTINRGNYWAMGYTIVIPYVIEGPVNDISQANPVAELGRFKEPAIPQLILHNPPGDMSTVTYQTNQKTCRNISQKVTSDESVTGNLAVKLGIAGSTGMFITTNFEFSATISASVGAGSSVATSNGRENCIEILNAISTLPGLPANQGSIYMGYASEIAYGVYPTVSIRTSPSFAVVKDSSLIFGVVPNSDRPFYMTKTEILKDMRDKQIIADTTSVQKIKTEVLSQISIWKQVLEKDSLNINNPSNEIITPSFTISGGQGPNQSSTTTSITTTDSYEVSHYIEAGLGASFVISLGGSGVSGGVEFKTKKTVGQTVNVSGSTGVTIAYNLQDDDGSVNGSESDVFQVKIVKDPTYGTPIFLLDSSGSQTSCPYEGGYPRNQPNLKIVGSNSRDITISDVTLGTAGKVNVQVCNNSNEVRSYGLGFVNASATSNLVVKSNSNTGTVNPSLGITQFASILNVPAGGCKVGSYELSMARDENDAGAPMSYENIEFVTYAECEPEIRSSILASVNFAGPPPPTGVSASPSEICSPVPVTLTVDCPPTTSARWYTTAVGGFPFEEGESVTITPTVNTTYYVGCETPNYARDRVATQPVLFANNAQTLSLNSDFSTNSLQIANTTLTATNKINDPARVKYKAGNSLTFNPGFEAKDGSTFEAEIGGCVN